MWRGKVTQEGFYHCSRGPELYRRSRIKREEGTNTREGMVVMRYIINCHVFFAVITILFVLVMLGGCGIFEDSVDHDGENVIVWKVDNSPYVVDSTLVVEKGQTLIIEPGVIVRFDPGVALVVRGNLIAQGTAEDSIVFTSDGMLDENHPNLWGGIIFEDCSNESILEYCKIEHGGDFLIKIISSSPTISHCELKYIFPHAETGGAIIFCTKSSFPLIRHNLIYEFYNYHAAGIFCESSNPEIYDNDILCFESDCKAVIGGGFLSGNYLAVDTLIGAPVSYVPDTSLGDPVDETGDGICNTTSTSPLKLFLNVDGVRNPKSKPSLFHISVK